MIKTVNMQSSNDSITMSWLAPRFPPVTYKITYECGCFCDCTAYTSGTRYLMDEGRDHATVLGLRPGTKCHLTLKAIYNNANTNDPGMQRTATTQSASKSKL